jgi:hypothetical protein
VQKEERLLALAADAEVHAYAIDLGEMLRAYGHWRAGWVTNMLR